MKVLLLLTILLTLNFSTAKSQDKLSVGEKAVQHTVIQLFEALSNRDSMALKSYCTSDVLLFEYGMTWTLDTLIRKAIRFNHSEDFKRVNTIDFISTKIEKDVAWTTYNNQAVITQNSISRTIKWIETVILVRERKTWKVKLLHSTLLKKN